MTQATINNTAKASLEVTRSCVTSNNILSEKAVIKLPAASDEKAYDKTKVCLNDIEIYVSKIASKGLNAKNRYDVMLEFYGYHQPDKFEYIAVDASMALKYGKNSAEHVVLQKAVDDMVEEIVRTFGCEVAARVFTIPMRTEAEPKDASESKKHGYIPALRGNIL